MLKPSKRLEEGRDDGMLWAIVEGIKNLHKDTYIYITKCDDHRFM
jgi:hypothetical protein